MLEARATSASKDRGVAKLVKASDSESDIRRFESYHPRQTNSLRKKHEKVWKAISRLFCFCRKKTHGWPSELSAAGFLNKAGLRGLSWTAETNALPLFLSGGGSSVVTLLRLHERKISRRLPPILACMSGRSGIAPSMDRVGPFCPSLAAGRPYRLASSTLNALISQNRASASSALENSLCRKSVYYQLGYQ